MTASCLASHGLPRPIRSGGSEVLLVSDNNLIPKLNDEAILDEDGNDTGEVQTGLKTLWKAKQNEIAASLLAPSDWRVVEELEINSSFANARTAYPFLRG